MAKYKLKDLCEFITDGTHQTPEYCEKGGIKFLSSKDVVNQKINWDNVKYIPKSLHEKLYKRLSPRKDDILLAKNGTTGVAAIVDREDIFDVYVSLAVLRPLDIVYPKYLLYAINSQITKRQFDAGLKGVGVPNLHLSVIRETSINVVPKEKQKKICNILDKIKLIIDLENQKLNDLDYLIQSRFVELFGDLKSNNKRWPIVGFNECADIDTNMIHNFEGYEDYPHIGINCIEKETGRLIGYRTIAEDGVISGKYLFTPKHIIYSKIRPNLNKVALPDFKGLCSADAYPILVKSEICNREYFGYTLRSKYFLDYILAFSNRTNLPKVNKNQVEGFMLPLPPIDLQNQFAAFVQQVNKSKFEVQKSLEKTQLLFDSLMQEYFG